MYGIFQDVKGANTTDAAKKITEFIASGARQ
jgi:hypothetical protein